MMGTRSSLSGTGEGVAMDWTGSSTGGGETLFL